MSMMKTVADPAALTEAAARHFVDCARQALETRGRCAVVLSGGSTPRALYARLAQPDLADKLDWTQVFVFWGDERAVPPDHPESNYGMAYDTLLEHVPLPERNIFRISGEMAPAAAASEYEAKLRQFFATGRGQETGPVRARFDLVLLGMGADGHTASLFPGASAIQENHHWVAAYYVDALQAWRISLTPVAINAARQATFLVTGADKAARLKQVLYGPYQPMQLPAQVVRPDQGRLLWLVDEAAAGRRQPAAGDDVTPSGG